MSVELFGCLPGPRNALMDVPGVGVGHALCDNGHGDSGVSVVVAPEGAVASVDVRGGGPGTRETDLLSPHNTVGEVHAVALCGGSAFGLDATAGVMAELEAQHLGFAVLGEDHPHMRVPIVPAAVIFDLLVGRWDSRPTHETGAQATRRALQAYHTAGKAQHFIEHSADMLPDAQGNIGAGVAASAGALKGGIGQASAIFPTGSPLAGRTVSALMVVNPQGSVFNPEDGGLWGVDAELGGEFGSFRYPHIEPQAREIMRNLNVMGTKIPPTMLKVQKLNTTIGVVVTDAVLSKAQAQRIAVSCHDGVARAIRPAHLPMDGDTVFALSTAARHREQSGGTAVPQAEGLGCREATLVEMTMLSAVAANCVERAIAHAVLSSESAFGIPCWKEVSGYAKN